MEYIKDLLKKSGWLSIVASLIFIILGIILVGKPDLIMSIIAYIIGGIFIAVGVIRILSYIKKNKGSSNDDLNYELIFGIMTIVIGLVVIIYREFIAQIFGIVIGIWIIYSGVVRFSASLNIKKSNSNLWIYSMVIAGLMFIAGLYVVLSSGAILIATIGIIMIIYAILDIVESVIFMNTINKM